MPSARHCSVANSMARPHALVAVTGGDEQLVKEGVVATILQAVAEGHGEIADALASALDQPDASQRGVPHELRQGTARGVLLEGIPLARVELGHERQQKANVGLPRLSEPRLHRRSPCLPAGTGSGDLVEW